MVVREHQATGADLFEITVLKPGFDPAALKPAIDAFGADLKSEPRGLSIFRFQITDAPAEPGYVRATFAVDGALDRTQQTMRLDAIARAFASLSKPNAVRAVRLQFENVEPEIWMLRRYRSEAIQIEASDVTGPIGLEYQMRITTDDPAAIVIPTAKDAAQPERASPPAPSRGVDFTVVALILLAAISAAGLVYSLLLRGRPPQQK